MSHVHVTHGGLAFGWNDDDGVSHEFVTDARGFRIVGESHVWPQGMSETDRERRRQTARTAAERYLMPKDVP